MEGQESRPNTVRLVVFDFREALAWVQCRWIEHVRGAIDGHADRFAAFM